MANSLVYSLLYFAAYEKDTASSFFIPALLEYHSNQIPEPNSSTLFIPAHFRLPGKFVPIILSK